MHIFYSNGVPVELPKELQERCESCLNLLNLTNVHRKLISPFSVYGYDLFHAGKILNVEKNGSSVFITI